MLLPQLQTESSSLRGPSETRHRLCLSCRETSGDSAFPHSKSHSPSNGLQGSCRGDRPGSFPPVLHLMQCPSVTLASFSCSAVASLCSPQDHRASGCRRLNGLPAPVPQCACALLSPFQQVPATEASHTALRVLRPSSLPSCLSVHRTAHASPRAGERPSHCCFSAPIDMPGLLHSSMLKKLF